MNASPKQPDAFEPADPALYFRPIDDLQCGDAVILCARVSTPGQKASGNLDHQVQLLRLAAAERGAIVVDEFAYVWPGSDFSWLLPAIKKARECGAKLLAASLSRFIRSEEYHPARARSAQPSQQQLEELRELSEGVELITVLSPTATPTDERIFETNRGQKAKGKRGGRPAKNSPGYKIRRRLRFQLLVRKLRTEGDSWSEIVRRTGLPKTTIRDWAT